MKQKALFYHAGCPVCVNAEEMVVAALDRGRYEVEVVHLGSNKQRVREAAAKGVVSVPALVLDEQVFHVNFGASLDDLKRYRDAGVTEFNMASSGELPGEGAGIGAKFEEWANTIVGPVAGL